MPLSEEFKNWYDVGSTFRFREHAIFYKDVGAGNVTELPNV